MKAETKKLLHSQLFTRVQEQYGLESPHDVSHAFNITGPQEEKLLGAVQSKVSFLTKINLLPVTDVIGEKVFAGTQQGITGRMKDGRFRRRIGENGAKYQLVETDSGIIIPWQKLDMWARYRDRFLTLYSEFVQRQIALDMLTIGWRGTSVAASTDIDGNPLLQDVNKGWMQWMRDNLPENIMADGAEAGVISIFGDGADYGNLDQLAYDLKQGLGDIHRDRGDLVFLVGSDLVAKEADIISKMHGLTPTERGATKQHELMGTFGGLPAITPPNFPSRGAVITPLDNLSIYTQTGSLRRKIKDDDDLKGLIDSFYRNEGYVVEDETAFVGIEFDNVVFPEERSGASISVSGVTVLPGDPSVAVGATVQMTVDITPEGATDKTGVWASSDETVATVDETGLVTGVAAGETDVSFTSNDGGKSDSETVTVTA